MLRFNSLFSDHEFPPWRRLPKDDEDDPDKFYHKKHEKLGGWRLGHANAPKRHWCFLGKIESFELFKQHRRIAKATVTDGEGETVVVGFWFGNYNRFNFDKLCKGHTIAVAYAHQNTMIDGTVGIRVEKPWHVRIFPIGLVELQQISSDLQYILERLFTEYHRTYRPDPRIELYHCGKCKTWHIRDKECHTEGERAESHTPVCQLLSDPCFRTLIKQNLSYYDQDYELIFPKQRRCERIKHDY